MKQFFTVKHRDGAEMILTMVYAVQNYWALEHWMMDKVHKPSSSVQRW
jgi:hypothetical protein